MYKVLYEKKSGNIIRLLNNEENYDETIYGVYNAQPPKWQGLHVTKDGKLEQYDLELTSQELAEKLEDEKNHLRNLREALCFSIINRGQLWYDKLANEQRTELETWYQEWLDITETKEMPDKPTWLN